MLPYFQGYLKALGMKRTAEVQRDAKIGEAEAKKDSGIKVITLFSLDHHHWRLAVEVYVSCRLVITV